MSIDPELRTDLVVRRQGRPAHEAPTLLLLHGLTDAGAGWADAVEAWGRQYSLLVVDQRGHGESPRFTADQLAAHPGEVMVEDVIGILEQVGESPVVIGHSLGGAVALDVGARRPDLVRALVLEDPAPRSPGEAQRDPGRGKEFLAGIQGSLEAEDDEALLRHRRALHPDWSETELRTTGRAEQQMDLDYLTHGDHKPGAEWPELFTALIVPTLVVSGDDQDEVCVDHEMEQGIEELGNPNVRVVRIRGSGHCIRREQPAKYHQIVSDFLIAH
ncbi:MAG: hypothetical protein AVDCRST_MAG72-1725 [uncultured Nocardioidaceae bacterium]|uniref:AB hydrolase-1 domain-containing protein n=1 Tax=uncultured Nocardioidaceae bacterium TaxID=253824 RepID=A0A6J4MDL0_9ACTN|nr:MAG: hypothetical protein AVDCRST_MAG72-1725 [uncultured Nocardioidaceae bacterium]